VIVQLQRYQIKGRDAHDWIQRPIFLGGFDQVPVVDHAAVDTAQRGMTIQSVGQTGIIVTTTTDISDQPLVLIDRCGKNGLTHE
jgi:hypothetical protein